MGSLRVCGLVPRGSLFEGKGGVIELGRDPGKYKVVNTAGVSAKKETLLLYIYICVCVRLLDQERERWGYLLLLLCCCSVEES